jgi:hypothetical protein
VNVPEEPAVLGVELGSRQVPELAALGVRAEVLHVHEEERRALGNERHLAGGQTVEVDQAAASLAFN